jgi:hypothetical protein
MDALSANSSASSGTSVLKEATNVKEKMLNQMMESLPETKVTSTPQVSGLASEGIGSNLDLKA